MKYNKIKKLSDVEFRRATGVKKKTFKLMVDLVKEFEKIKSKKNKKGAGRPNKLPLEDRLLMTLEYLREYRTYFHISNSYEISETRCHENIKKIENILIKSGKFNLPKRKEKLLTENELEIFLIDATETPIERPKKKDKKP